MIAKHVLVLLVLPYLLAACGEDPIPRPDEKYSPIDAQLAQQIDFAITFDSMSFNANGEGKTQYTGCRITQFSVTGKPVELITDECNDATIHTKLYGDMYIEATGFQGVDILMTPSQVEALLK